MLPVFSACVGWQQVERAIPLAERAIIPRIVQVVVVEQVVIDEVFVVLILIKVLQLDIVLHTDLSRVHFLRLGHVFEL